MGIPTPLKSKVFYRKDLSLELEGCGESETRSEAGRHLRGNSPKV
jgi:hypothetical protein